MPMKRLPTSNYILAIWLGLLLIVFYLAVDRVMGNPKYLYHDEGGGGGGGGFGVGASSDSAVDAGGHVIEYVVFADAEAEPPPDEDDGGDGASSRAALHPRFLYATDDDYVPPPRVVEFYAPWCSHCRHFAPKYVRVAAQVSVSHPDVRFHAVSCVAHKALCNAQNVTGYPTVRVYRGGSYEARKWTPGGDDAGGILRELGLLESDDKSDAEGVVGGGGGRGGGELATSREGRTTGGGGKLRKRVKTNTSPPPPKNKDEQLTRKKKSIDKKKKKKNEIARVVPFRPNDVHDSWSDAALSFEFALRNGIYVENGPLDSGREKSFHEWLILLSKTLPPQMNRTLDIVDAILSDFPRAAGGQGGLDDLVRERVGRSGEGGTTNDEPSWIWKTCTYGDGNVGYTCGLWQLFHVVSLGVVEYNRHNPPMPTRYVSDTLRDYIDHFFQCEVCRMNFLSMYDTCAFDGCNRLSENPSLSEDEWRELPLWLWETHNDVNVRLMGERLERNAEKEPNQWESQQARWPSLYACPNCWRDDRSWEDEEVFKFLRSSYWSGNPSYMKIPPPGDDGSVDGRSRMVPLRWKLAAVVFATVALILHMYNTKRRKKYSGKHKK